MSFAWDDLDSTTPDENELATWQAKAAARFPEVAELADLMNGDSEQAVMSLAQDMANRVKAGQLPPDTKAQTPAPAAPDAPPGSKELYQRLTARARDGHPNAPEDMAAWATAKLREAAG